MALNFYQLYIPHFKAASLRQMHVLNTLKIVVKRHLILGIISS